MPSLDEQAIADPTGTVLTMLTMLRESPPCRFYNPTDRTVIVNRLEIFVPKGEAKPKAKGQLPTPMRMGCEAIVEMLRLDPDAPSGEPAAQPGSIRVVGYVS